MAEKKIHPEWLFTPQESLFIGSTPEKELLLGDQRYIPQGISIRQLSIEEAIQLREKKDYQDNSLLAAFLGIKDGALRMKFGQLDPLTGKTLEDPKIIGVVDFKSHILTRYNEADKITKDLYAKYREGGIDLGPREISREGEHKG